MGLLQNYHLSDWIETLSMVKKIAIHGPIKKYVKIMNPEKLFVEIHKRKINVKMLPS